MKKLFTMLIIFRAIFSLLLPWMERNQTQCNLPGHRAEMVACPLCRDMDLWPGMGACKDGERMHIIHYKASGKFIEKLMQPEVAPGRVKKLLPGNYLEACFLWSWPVRELWDGEGKGCTNGTQGFWDYCTIFAPFCKGVEESLESLSIISLS